MTGPKIYLDIEILAISITEPKIQGDFLNGPPLKMSLDYPPTPNPLPPICLVSLQYRYETKTFVKHLISRVIDMFDQVNW